MRLYVRIDPGDRLLLNERAAARGMPSVTYVAVLVRSHLRYFVPPPKLAPLALRSAVAELGATGRNLMQIARAMSQGARVAGPGREELRAMMQVGSALRDHVKSLLVGNAKSWDLSNPLLMAATAVAGLIAFPLLQPTWIMLK
jgi:hypothetical protein